MQKLTWSTGMGWAGAIALGCLVWGSCTERRPIRHDDDDDDETTTSVTSSSTGSVGSGSSGTGGASGTGSGTGGAGGQSGTCPMGACSPKAAVCNKVTSCCLALEDNQFKPAFTLRMAQLTITAPKLLTAGVVANIVANGVQMNLEECNLAGDGTMSWLLELNPSTNKLKTGGAKPVSEPTAGYCFVNEVLDGITVAPVQVGANLKLDQFSADVGDLVLPLYLDKAGSSYILLPFRSLSMTGGLSPDRNCVGEYNADTLSPASNCLAEPPNNPAFTNKGAVDGAVTLEDADDIIVDTLSQSLCVLLSGDASTYGDGGSPIKCKRNAATQQIVFKGDWCVGTDMPATAACYDAVHFEGQFAASAVKSTGNCP